MYIHLKHIANLQIKFSNVLINFSNLSTNFSNKGFSQVLLLIGSYPFEDAGNSKEGGGRDFLFVGPNGVEQVLSSVVETWSHFAEPLRVGCPQNNHLTHSRGARFTWWACRKMIKLSSLCRGSCPF